MSIQINIAAKNEALSAITSHPMCGRIQSEGSKLIVIFPAGDFRVGGVRCDNTADGMKKALKVMEREWMGSYPNKQ